MTETPIWLSKDIILNQITENKSLSHVKNYQDYVEEKNFDEIDIFRSTKITAPIFGSEIFKEKILSRVDIITKEASAPDFKRATTTPPIDCIIESTCEFYMIGQDMLMNTKRNTLNWPRLVCIYICRKYFGYSLRAISDSFRSKCLTTISTSIRKCELRLQQTPKLLSEVNHIHDLIRTKILKTDFLLYSYEKQNIR